MRHNISSPHPRECKNTATTTSPIYSDTVHTHQTTNVGMKTSVCLLVFVLGVFAEPPVPSSQYLPANTYGTPSFGGQTDAILRPSSQYGAPQRPTTQYGAPQRPSQQYGAPSTQYGAPGGGYDGPSEPANYQFEYAVQDAASGNDYGHQESRQGDLAVGKYYVVLPDGRKQIVEYTADTEGYHPKVSYEGGYTATGGYPGAGGGYPSGPSGGGYPSGPSGGGYRY